MTQTVINKVITTKGSAPKSKLNKPMWLLALILLIGGIVANYYYRDVAWAIRAAIGIVLLCLIAIVALQTTQGKAIWQFAKDARLELRKVVWPTRQETIQTTMIVIAMVVVVSLLLWGIDSILMWGVSWLTGQRG